MPKKHRLVIDTNLWIIFLLTRDFSKLDRLMSPRQATLLISQELLEEIVEVAERPKFRKYFDVLELSDLLINLQQRAELIQVNSQISICRDDKDNFLLSVKFQDIRYIFLSLKTLYYGVIRAHLNRCLF